MKDAVAFNGQRYRRHFSGCRLRSCSATSSHVGFRLSQNISRWRGSCPKSARLRCNTSRKLKRTALRGFVGSFRAACWGLIESIIKLREALCGQELLRIVKLCSDAEIRLNPPIEPYRNLLAEF